MPHSLQVRLVLLYLVIVAYILFVQFVDDFRALGLVTLLHPVPLILQF